MKVHFFLSAKISHFSPCLRQLVSPKSFLSVPRNTRPVGLRAEGGLKMLDRMGAKSLYSQTCSRNKTTSFTVTLDRRTIPVLNFRVKLGNFSKLFPFLASNLEKSAKLILIYVIRKESRANGRTVL